MTSQVSFDWQTPVRLLQAQRLFAVVDSCDAPSVPRRLRSADLPFSRSLYTGTKDEELWAIAPYFTKLDNDLLLWIKSELWNQPWGFFAVPQEEHKENFELLWKHFRQFLLVNAGGKQVYFRFYDPRVLPSFLDTCSSAQKQRFFGPFSHFGVSQPCLDDKAESGIQWLSGSAS